MPYQEPTFLYQQQAAQTAVQSLNNYFLSLYPLIINTSMKVVAALFILIVGWLLAFLIKLFVEFILSKVNFEDLIRRTKIDKYFKDFSWEEKLDKFLAEIIFWVVFIIFLMTSFDVLGFQAANAFISKILNYIPTALSGGFILALGFFLAEIIRKIVVGFLRGIEKNSANAIATFVKFSIIIFSVLAAFSQWGIGTEIINTLAMGMVLFIALAGGLAFGLGGQEIAREVLEKLRKELK